MPRRRRKCLPYGVRCRPRNAVALTILCLLLVVAILTFFPHTLQFPKQMKTSNKQKIVLTLQPLNTSALDVGSKDHCRFHVCFNINRCTLSLREDKLGVYISDSYDFQDPTNSISLSLNVSKEYTELLEAVRTSRYHVPHPSKACVFIPPIDTLAQQNLDVNAVSAILNTLPQ